MDCFSPPCAARSLDGAVSLLFERHKVRFCWWWIIRVTRGEYHSNVHLNHPRTFMLVHFEVSGIFYEGCHAMSFVFNMRSLGDTISTALVERIENMNMPLCQWRHWEMDVV